MKLEPRSINLFLRKDEAATAFVYKKTSGLLFHIAFGILRDESLAEEAMLDAYVSLFGKPVSFENDKAFIAYLCEATRNASLSLLEKRKETLPLEEEEVGQNEKNRDTGLLDLMEKTLGKEDFDIFFLHVNEELSFPEISLYLKLGSPSSVRSRYFRAKKTLQTVLKKEGIL